MTRFYVKTVPLKVRLTPPLIAFLKTMAGQYGINHSEFLRRILIDCRQKYVDTGLYDPDLEAEGRQTEETGGRRASIDLRPGENGGVKILFPEGLPAAIKRELQWTLGRHLPALKTWMEAEGDG